jgi:hypothetical protein
MLVEFINGCISPEISGLITTLSKGTGDSIGSVATLEV